MIRNIFRPLTSFFGGHKAKAVQPPEPPKTDIPTPEVEKTGVQRATRSTRTIYALTPKQRKARHKAQVSKAGRNRQQRLSKGLYV